MINRKNSKFVKEILEKEYNSDLDLNAGLNLAAKCLKKNIDNPGKCSDIVTITKEGVKFLTENDLKSLYAGIEE